MLAEQADAEREQSGRTQPQRVQPMQRGKREDRIRGDWIVGGVQLAQSHMAAGDVLQRLQTVAGDVQPLESADAVGRIESDDGMQLLVDVYFWHWNLNKCQPIRL